MTMRRILFYVLPSETGLTLGRLLRKRLPAVPRGKLRSLLIRGDVKLGGRMQRDTQARLEAGWSVQLPVPGNLGNSPMGLSLRPGDVLYRDDDLLVVEKPASVKVHRNHPGETVVTMQEAAQALVGGQELYLVHRLDRGTSGVLVFARSKEVAGNLGRQFSRQKVQKTYLALVEGEVPEEGLVEHSLHRSSGRALIDPERGKPCATRFRRLGASASHSLVRCEPTSGRFHQIRAHMASLGCPLAGDLLYGGRLGIGGGRGKIPLDLPGPLLHCLALEFSLPGSGKRVEVRTRFPARFREALERAGIPPRSIGDRPEPSDGASEKPPEKPREKSPEVRSGEEQGFRRKPSQPGGERARTGPGTRGGKGSRTPRPRRRRRRKPGS